MSTPPDLRFFRTTDTREDEPQPNVANSLGGFKSGTAVQVFNPIRHTPMPGITIDNIGLEDGPGTFVIAAPTEGSLQFGREGEDLGTEVTIANGATVTLTADNDHEFIIVTRTSANPLGGTESLSIRDNYNNAVAGTDFIDSEVVGGGDKYKAIFVENVGDDDLQNVTLTVGSGTVTVGKEAPGGSGDIQTIANETTAPAAISFGASTNLGTLTAGDTYGVWIKNTVVNGETADARVEIVIDYTYYNVTDDEDFDGEIRGLRRVADDAIDEYELYYVDGTPPDPNVDTADKTSATLPFTDTASLTEGEWYTRVFRRNRFNLVSGSLPEYDKVFRIDSGGALLPTRPQAPATFTVTPAAAAEVLISATYYPGTEATTEVNIALLRATHWLLYISGDGTPPDPSVDSPTVVAMDDNDTRETLFYTTSSSAFLDGAPVEVLVRTRRTDGDGDTDSNNTATVSTTAEIEGPSGFKALSAFNETEGFTYDESGDFNETIYVDQPNNIRFVHTPGEVTFWADTVIVWKVLESFDKLYIPNNWSIINGTVSGAGTGTIEVASWPTPKQIYINVNGTRTIDIDVTNLEITVNGLDSTQAESVAGKKTSWIGGYTNTRFLVEDVDHIWYHYLQAITGGGTDTQNFNGIDQSKTQVEVDAL
jgi:hypothetical protein